MTLDRQLLRRTSDFSLHILTDLPHRHREVPRETSAVMSVKAEAFLRHSLHASFLEIPVYHLDTGRRLSNIVDIASADSYAILPRVFATGTQEHQAPFRDDWSTC